MRHHGTAFERGMRNVPKSEFASTGVFGRMFPSLPSCDFADNLLRKLGSNGGIMDEGAGNASGNSETIAAGITFFGQFIDHDITFDPTSSLERQNDPAAIHNFRTPLLELDSVYGSGPEASPFLYQQRTSRNGQNDPAKLLIGVNDKNEPIDDLPRNSQGVALIGDPRNDENLIISQMQLAFLKFHNCVVDYLRADGTPEGEIFEEAQQLVRWHYQWIVVNEYLPLIIGRDLTWDILEHGPRHYPIKEDPFIPVEFAVAAFRFGHTQVRETYTVNASSGSLTLFGGLGRGFEAVPAEKRVDWRFFFDIDPKITPAPSRKIDPKLAGVLFDLPFVFTEDVALKSLAVRNLLRSESFTLPWGQRVAQAMGVKPLTDEELGLTALGFPTNRAPLWYYLLREAEVRSKGEHLGPVGGRIVGEVLLGLLQGDSKSYLCAAPDWKPTLPANEAGTFTLADMLVFAGAVPTPPSEQVYTVKSGDTLRKIAQHVYGNELRWRMIYNANRDKINNPDLIRPGQELVIPA
jgi:hypothetical protein